MEQAKPVLVVGATGFLGTEICRQLVAGNTPVRALVRETSDPQKVKALQDMGVETVTGDLKDRASLALACDDVQAVISTASSTLSRAEGDSIETVDRYGQLNLVEAAEQAFIGKFVYISFPEMEGSFPLQDAKREVENRLMDSSLDFTILRPTFFMEVWLGPHLGFDVANAKATVYGHGANRISWISVRDVAKFTVMALDHDAAVNTIVELGGPDPLSLLEAVSIFEEAVGRTFDLQYIPEEALRTQMQVTPDPLQRTFAGLMLNLSTSPSIHMEDTLQVFPVSLFSVRDYCRLIMQGETAPV